MASQQPPKQPDTGLILGEELKLRPAEPPPLPPMPVAKEPWKLSNLNPSVESIRKKLSTLTERQKVWLGVVLGVPLGIFGIWLVGELVVGQRRNDREQKGQKIYFEGELRIIPEPRNGYR